MIRVYIFKYYSGVIMENNKNKIVEAAFILALKNGFDSVSIKQIREKTELSAGSIYYYFKNKDEILDYMVNVYIIDNFHDYMDSVRNFDGTFMEKIKFILKYLTNFNQQEFSATDFTLRESSQKAYFVLFVSIYHQYPEVQRILFEMQKELDNFYNELIREAIAKKEISADVDIEALNVFIQTIFYGFIVSWSYPGERSFETLFNSNLKMIDEMLNK